jgi:hypothetical protein
MKLLNFFIRNRKNQKSKVERKFIKQLNKSKIAFVTISKPTNRYGENVEGHYYKSDQIDLFKNHLFKEVFHYNRLIEIDKLYNCKISYYDSWDDIVVTNTFPCHRISAISYVNEHLPLP